MSKTSKPVALKEWAAAINALREGKQILVMRKGGISEEMQDFQVESHAFYLYPTYEHQKKELMKDAHKEEIDRSLASWTPADTAVRLTAYAEVQEDIEIHSQEALNKLASQHIWTDAFASERLKWKKKNPLHVLLLRVYELERPLEIPVLPEYLGCKSWLQIAGDSLPDADRRAVLSDAEFARRVDAVHSALEGAL